MPGPHNGGPHSGPYQSQDPNTPEDERHRQAGEILYRLGRGESAVTVARSMGIARSTLYERTALISGQLPSVDLVRLIHYERLEHMYEGLDERAGGNSSNADYARLRAEQRQVLARQSALLRVESSEAPEPPEPDDVPDPWVDGARADSDAELAAVEAELRARRDDNR